MSQVPASVGTEEAESQEKHVHARGMWGEAGLETSPGPAGVSEDAGAGGWRRSRGAAHDPGDGILPAATKVLADPGWAAPWPSKGSTRM